jgi:hypothetical protein
VKEIEDYYEMADIVKNVNLEYMLYKEDKSNETREYFLNKSYHYSQLDYNIIYLTLLNDRLFDKVNEIYLNGFTSINDDLKLYFYLFLS